MIIIARTTGDPLVLGKTVENAIHDLNADLVVFDVTTLELRQQIASFGQRVAGTFVGAFGLLALVLAAVGIYGVTAYTTRQRTHEIGIRMALGASQNNILRLVTMNEGYGDLTLYRNSGAPTRTVGLRK